MSSSSSSNNKKRKASSSNEHEHGESLIFDTIAMPGSNVWSFLEQTGFAAGGTIVTGLTDVAFTLLNTTALKGVEGKAKWGDQTVLNSFHKFFKTTAIKEVREFPLPANYTYFGTLGNYESYFTELLKNNPFFVSALKKKGNGYELNFTNENGTWLSRIVGNLDDTYIRFNVEVNADFTIGALTAFKKTGLKYAPYTPPAPPAGCSAREYSILGALFLTLYYAEVVHASLHVYHYVMCAGMEDSVRDQNDMKWWCDKYDDGIWIKYQEVKGVLFAPGGALTGTANAGGFIASQTAVLNTATALWKSWAAMTDGDEFIQRFILGGVGGTYPAGALQQHAAEASDIGKFAADLTNAFTSIDNGKPMKKAVANIKLFFGSVWDKEADASPFAFHLQDDSFRRWITLMSATGILHAGTFSFSRLFITQPIMAFLRPGVASFSKLDTSAIALITGTIIGIKDGRHVYNNASLGYGFLSDKRVKAVLNAYEGRSEARRTAYFYSICDEPDFPTLGWLRTDYCQDLVDNKQVTNSTYV